MSAYIGLDVHKESTFATVLDQSGRVVVRRKLARALEKKGIVRETSPQYGFSVNKAYFKSSKHEIMGHS